MAKLFITTGRAPILEWRAVTVSVADYGSCYGLITACGNFMFLKHKLDVLKFQLLVSAHRPETQALYCFYFSPLYFCDYALLSQVIDAENRFRESNRRSAEAGSSKKNRRSPFLPSIWKPKRDSMTQKDAFVPEGSQKKKFYYQDFSPLELQESYHDSSVDKVQK